MAVWKMFPPLSPNSASKLHRRQHLAVQHRRGEAGRSSSSMTENTALGVRRLGRWRPPTGDGVGRVLSEEGGHVVAGRGESWVKGGGDGHLDDGAGGGAAAQRLSVALLDLLAVSPRSESSPCAPALASSLTSLVLAPQAGEAGQAVHGEVDLRDRARWCRWLRTWRMNSSGRCRAGSRPPYVTVGLTLDNTALGAQLAGHWRGARLWRGHRPPRSGCTPALVNS